MCSTNLAVSEMNPSLSSYYYWPPIQRRRQPQFSLPAMQPTSLVECAVRLLCTPYSVLCTITTQAITSPLLQEGTHPSALRYLAKTASIAALKRKASWACLEPSKWWDKLQITSASPRLVNAGGQAYLTTPLPPPPLAKCYVLGTRGVALKLLHEMPHLFLHWKGKAEKLPI